MSSIFIIGAGPGVGQAVALKFKQEGWKVALGSRSPKVDEVKSHGFFPVEIDITKEESIAAAFKIVEKELGAPPNVVVYNRECQASLGSQWEFDWTNLVVHSGRPHGAKVRQGPLDYPRIRFRP